MQARGFLNYRLKYCWPKCIYCVCQVVNQTNLNGKLRKSWGGQALGQAKIWGGMVDPGPP